MHSDRNSQWKIEFLWKNFPQRSVKMLNLDAFASPDGHKGFGPGHIMSRRSSRCSKPEVLLALRGIPLRGRLLVTGLLRSWRAQRAPSWTAVHSVAREWVLVIAMFHPGHSLGPHFLWKCENRNVMPFRLEKCFQGWSQKKRCLLGVPESRKCFLISWERAEPRWCFQGQGLTSISQITLQPGKEWWGAGGRMHHHTVAVNKPFSVTCEWDITWSGFQTKVVTKMPAVTAISHNG